MKRIEWVNEEYLIAHAEEIINNTDVLFPDWTVRKYAFSYANKELHDIWVRLQRKQLHESGNWYIFGRGERWIRPSETWEEAEYRIVREYCEATGHWNLFIWEDGDEDDD